MKKLLATLGLLSLITLLVVACGRGPAANSSSTSNSTAGSATDVSSNYTVHMGDQSFTQSSITISKGSSITLVDDSAVPHIIANGSWVNSSAQPMQENGMPTMNHMQATGKGDSHSIGPFESSGTFHLYCTVHPGMSLTIIVQ